MLLARKISLLRLFDGRKRLLLFAVACAGLFRYYCHQPDVLHPLVVKALDLLIGKRTRPAPALVPAPDALGDGETPRE